MDVSNFTEDLLEREEFAHRLESFLLTEQKFVPDGLVIALSAKFGSGKTTFLRMWKSRIDTHSSPDNAFIAVTLNAWESDYLGDPLLAIISDLTEQLSKTSAKGVEKLIDCTKKFGWFAIAMGNQVVKSVSGIDPIAAGEFTEKKTSGKKPPVDLFSIYKQKKEAMAELKDALRQCIDSSPSQILFLVDELDRCRPDYAITYLETIKHIFDIKGAIFVLAADRKQLENVAKKSFGSNLDFNEYYRKFIHREICLPEISEKGCQALTRSYVEKYMSVEGVRLCFLKIPDRMTEIISLVSQYGLTPRQTQEVFRLLGHILETPEAENAGKLRWCLGVGSILMCTLKVGDPRLYDVLGRKGLSADEAISFTSPLSNPHEKQWWLNILFTGGAFLEDGSEKEGGAFHEVLSRLGLNFDG
ncbi:MAG TPA: P-loop NTPase fold protein, partial [Rhodocyclaceae bacterium]|nr:P-loop NTPase fold protein [Rhodocyclaceae bacterium]